ncbi:MAG: bacterial Ig-like domain-containing protein [Bacilli bacterium]|nr:bacterial Ig-like domain-containing protein [Bacilli bacterium]
MLKISKSLLIASAALLLVGCGGSDEKAPREYLTILTFPNKTLYNAGNNFDKEGLTLDYTDKEGNRTTVTDFAITGGKNLKASQDSITVSYRGLSVDVDISVNKLIEGQITCVGDSLTEGHSWPTESYPNYIDDNLGGHLVTVSNCGKNGASFKDFGRYNPAYNATEQYQTSLTGSPIVLSILLGTNDATNWENEKNDYVKDYTDLVNTYRTTFGEDLNIIMMTSPRTKTPNQFNIPSDVICNEVVPLQRQLAQDLNCYLLDLNSEFEKYTDDQLFRPDNNDGVHLTKMAAEITANLLAEKIKSIYGI